MDSEAALKAGDVCLDCQDLGLEKYLRYFKINLNGDTLLKCESNDCMYPYNNEMCSSDDDENSVRNLMETNSLTLINDLIDQCDHENIQNTNNDLLPINEYDAEQVTHFDITFLDDVNDIENTNICKSEVSVESKEYFVDEFNVKIIENKYFSMPTFNSIKNENPDAKIKDRGSQSNDKILVNDIDDTINSYPVQYEISYESNENNLPCLRFTHDNGNDCKQKKYQHPCYNDLPTSSKTFTMLKEIPSKKPNSAEPQAAHQLIVAKSEPSQSSREKVESQPILDLTKKSPRKYVAPDIPKADIMKGNALLKKLAEGEVNDKSPYISPKCKDFRNRRIRNHPNIKKHKNPVLPNCTSPDYTFAKISEMILSKNMKINKNK